MSEGTSQKASGVDLKIYKSELLKTETETKLFKGI